MHKNWLAGTLKLTKPEKDKEKGAAGKDLQVLSITTCSEQAQDATNDNHERQGKKTRKKKNIGTY